MKSKLVCITKRCAALLLAAACLQNHATRAAELTVFAAASLTDALRQLGTNYQARTADKIFFNFAASSLLARQIQEGAPADLFFSADEAKMDMLEKRGLILNGTRKARLSNSLVVVVPSRSTFNLRSPDDLTNAVVKQLALADPKAVPAGIYSKAYLEERHLWSAVESKVVPTDNVRAALAAVESGNAEAAMVFKTDAAISKRVRVVCEIPRDEGPDISYPVAVVKSSSQIEAAKKFLQYLNSDEASKVFQKFGFVVLN